jgi:hypothetical protein
MSAAMFEVFTAVKIQIEVFWVVTPCSVVLGYRRFGGPYCLHLQGIPILVTHVQVCLLMWNYIYIFKFHLPGKK